MITCAREDLRIWPSSSSETRGTPEGRTSHASFTRRKYGFAIAVISAIIAAKIPIATQIHHFENTVSFRPSRIPVSTIAPIETYIGIEVSPDRLIRSTIFRRSRSARIRYRTTIDVPWVPSSASTDRMCRRRIHW